MSDEEIKENIEEEMVNWSDLRAKKGQEFEENHFARIKVF